MLVIDIKFKGFNKFFSLNVLDKTLKTTNSPFFGIEKDEKKIDLICAIESILKLGRIRPVGTFKTLHFCAESELTLKHLFFKEAFFNIYFLPFSHNFLLSDLKLVKVE